MKPHLIVLMGVCAWAGLGGALSLRAQTPVPAVPSATAAVTEADELEQLVAPIALYPDALVALILPAATESADVVLAARFLEGGGAAEQAQTQGWDDSVKRLVHYPEVVKWMNENLAWTRQIGEAYLDQPAEVMAAIQRARARAHANGVLVTTPQQRVVVEGGYIMIVPAQPEVIYVPRYDPEIIYVERAVYLRPDPWLTFGVGFGVGWWLNYDCDWHRRVIVIDRHHRHRDYWRARHDWRHHRYVHGPHHDHERWRPWAPRPDRLRHLRHAHPGGRPHRAIARPGPIAGAPRFDRGGVRPHREHYQAGARVAAPRDRAGAPGNVSPRAPRKPGEQSPLSNNTGIRRFRPSPGEPPHVNRGQPFDRSRPPGGERGNPPPVVRSIPRVAPGSPAPNPPAMRQPRTQDRPRQMTPERARELSQRREAIRAQRSAPVQTPQAPRVAAPAQTPRAAPPARVQHVERQPRVERPSPPAARAERPARAESSGGRGGRGNPPER